MHSQRKLSKLIGSAAAVVPAICGTETQSVGHRWGEQHGVAEGAR